MAYNYGVSGPFWYASGVSLPISIAEILIMLIMPFFQATVQVILFATLAIELKRRAPNAHTFLEVRLISWNLNWRDPSNPSLF